MRALVVDAYGAPPRVAELPDPIVGEGEIGIDVRAAAVNPADWKIADGLLDAVMPPHFPMVLGCDFAGTVVTAGHGADFVVGDEVFGTNIRAPLGSSGSYAERLTVPAGAAVARLPRGMRLEEAAALPTAGGTAVQVVQALDPKPGAMVLVIGGGGGVGSYVCELLAGRQVTVVATVRSNSRPRLLELGVAETIDHAEVEVVPAARRHAPRGFDALVSCTGTPATFAEAALLVRAGGTAVSLTFAADPGALQAHEIDGRNLRFTPTPGLMAEVAALSEAGLLHPGLVTEVGLADARGALLRSRAGHAAGKTVVLPYR